MIARGDAWVLLAAALATGIGSGSRAVAEERAASAPPLAQVHYMLHCQGCHLPDGGGSPGKVPALRDSVARYLTVEGGREYLVRVPGVSQSPLDDDELARVLNWVVARFGPTADARAAPPFTAAEVARVRRPPLTDVTLVRDRLRSGFASDEGLGPADQREAAALGRAPTRSNQPGIQASFASNPCPTC